MEAIWSGGWGLRKDLLPRLGDLGGTQGRNTKVGKGSRNWGLCGKGSQREQAGGRLWKILITTARGSRVHDTPGRDLGNPNGTGLGMEPLQCGGWEMFCMC